jgi:hypothetical protein
VAYSPLHEPPVPPHCDAMCVERSCSQECARLERKRRCRLTQFEFMSLRGTARGKPLWAGQIWCACGDKKSCSAGKLAAEFLNRRERKRPARLCAAEKAGGGNARTRPQSKQGTGGGAVSGQAGNAWRREITIRSEELPPRSDSQSGSTGLSSGTWNGIVPDASRNDGFGGS